MPTIASPVKPPLATPSEDSLCRVEVQVSPFWYQGCDPKLLYQALVNRTERQAPGSVFPMRYKKVLPLGYNEGMGYALHRMAIALLVLAFAMMPGLIVLHFWGLIAGSLVAASGPAILMARVAWRTRSRRQFKSYVTSECDIGQQLHPALTVACGAVFFGGGYGSSLWGQTAPASMKTG